MDGEQMKLAILKQEHTFRQQVQELHRLYHVQKQLMQQMRLAAASPATTNHHHVKKPKQEFQIVHGDNKPMKPGQLFGLSSSSTMAPAAASADDHSCSLELTLATGPSSSGSGSAAVTGGRTQQPGSKRLRSSSNSDSGTTAVSSTSTDSELALFGEVAGVTTEKAAAVRFQGEARRMEEMRHQGAWMYQCLSLRTA